MKQFQFNYVFLYSYSDIVHTQNNAVIVAWERWWLSSPNQFLVFWDKIDPTGSLGRLCREISVSNWEDSQADLLMDVK